MNIDLILLGKKTDPPVSWQWGEVINIPYDIQSLSSQIFSLSQNGGYVLFLDSAIPIPNNEVLERIISRKTDIAHAGPKFGSTTLIAKFLDIVAPISYFNLDQQTHIETTSWKISLKCALVKKEILIQFPFLDSQFNSVDIAGLIWGYQLIWKGAIMRYVPDLVANSSQVFDNVSTNDGLRFINYFYGMKWLAWTSLRLSFKSMSIEPLKSLVTCKFEKGKRTQKVKDYSGWRSFDLAAISFNVSVIIPTVDRYQYLFTVLNQLLEQDILPFEVIVIDQTSHDKRQHIEEADFSAIGLKVIHQEISGQCSSRNEGLIQSTGDFILFLDDDDEVNPDLIESHLKCLHFFNADVSCGVCDEIGAGAAPKEYNLIRMADVFPTNNGMLRRSVLHKSGLFDLTYNRGQKADGDLGARIYKSGALMILNPEIRVLHHRAPSGGLRKHNVRKVTYASSRRYITHFRLPHITEFYFNKRHFSLSQQREYVWLTILGTFSVRGGLKNKIIKILWAFLNIPLNISRLLIRNREALKRLRNAPPIPKL